MKKLFISVINYNGTANTIECLRSLQQLHQRQALVHVVVVDNNSKQPINVRARDFPGLPITVIKNNKNLGFSGGHNVGIRYALQHDADYIMLLNNDTLANRNLTDELMKVIMSDDTIGIVGPKIYFSKGFEYHKDRYERNDLGKVLWYAGGIMDWDNVHGFHRGVDEVDFGQYDRLEATEFVSGCCMVIAKDAFKKVGMLDERYFLYYEDIDLNQRMKKANFKIMYVPTAILWHKNAASAGGSGSELQDYFITRNRLLLGFTYAPYSTKLPLLRESLDTLMTGRKWQRRGVLDFYLRRFGKGSYRLP